MLQLLMLQQLMQILRPRTKLILDSRHRINQQQQTKLRLLQTELILQTQQELIRLTRLTRQTLLDLLQIQLQQTKLTQQSGLTKRSQLTGLTQQT